MKAGEFIVDSVGDIFKICNEEVGRSCSGCEKESTCNTEADIDFICACHTYHIIFKRVDSAAFRLIPPSTFGMAAADFNPLSITKATVEQLVNELRSRGFKGVITKEEVITQKIEL